MKKGRHRRFEEARALKRLTEVAGEPCDECGAPAGEKCKPWCLARVLPDEPEDDGYEEEEAAPRASY